MPEWEIMLWNENNFDVNSIPWTRQAYQAGKYAFVSDFVRLKALYDYGGIYLDTDVELFKSLSPLVEKFESFSGFENNQVLTSAVISAKKGHPLIYEFMQYYFKTPFSESIVSDNQANVLMMTNICKRHGLLINDKEQDLIIDIDRKITKFHIFPQTYFCPLDFYHNKKFSRLTYCVHYFDASWLEPEVKRRIERERRLIYKILLNIKRIIKKLFVSL